MLGFGVAVLALLMIGLVVGTALCGIVADGRCAEASVGPCDSCDHPMGSVG